MDVFANLELPAVTVALMAASGFMQRNWLWVLFGIAVLYVIAKAVLELPKIRLEVDRIKLKIPKIGILIQTIYTARFARTLLFSLHKRSAYCDSASGEQRYDWK